MFDSYIITHKLPLSLWTVVHKMLHCQYAMRSCRGCLKVQTIVACRVVDESQEKLQVIEVQSQVQKFELMLLYSVVIRKKQRNATFLRMYRRI